MDELIAQVSQRTGLPPEQAKLAAQAVLEFLKGRLPAPLASHLDQFLGGSPAAGGEHAAGLADLAQGLGGMFGRKP
jgi:hypothetical protein